MEDLTQDGRLDEATVRFLAETIDKDAKYIVNKSLRENGSGDVPEIPAVEIGELSASDSEDLSRAEYQGENDLSVLEAADRCFVARRDGQLIHHTCVAIEPFTPPRGELRLAVPRDSAYVYAIETKPGHRGDGIAPMVMHTIEQELRSNGVTRVFADVWIGNESSQRFFNQSGFRSIGSVHAFSHGGGTRCHLVLCEYPYYDEEPVFDAGDARAYISKDQDLQRIRANLPAILEEITSDLSEVALFGAGGHSHKLTEAGVDFGSWITVVLDNDPNKHGKRFAPTGHKIQSPEAVDLNDVDIVIVSSKAYQQEIAEQIRELSNHVSILILYPEIREWDHPTES